MFSVAAPLFAQALTLTVADSSELRARLDPGATGVATVDSATEEDEEYEAYFDAMTQPSATLLVSTRRTSYALTYAPQFTWLAIGNEEEYSQSVFHTGTLSATWSGKRTTVNLGQSFSYGTTNYRLAFTADPTTPGELPQEPDTQPDTPEPLAPDERLPGQEPTINEELTSGTSSTTLSVNHELSRTQTLSEFVNYSYSTGFGDDVDVYPKQRGGAVGAAFSQELGERDSISTAVGGSLFYTDPAATSTTGLGLRSIFAALRQNWTREWTEDLEVTLGIGLIYARTDEGDRKTETLLLDILPVGSTTIDYTWGYGGAHYTATLSLGTAPYVDRFTGVVDPRVFWSASLERVKRRLTLTATVAGSESSYSDDAGDLNADAAVRAVRSQSSASASVLATYEAIDRLFLRAGVQATSSVVLSQEALNSEAGSLPKPIYFGFVGLAYSYDLIRAD